MGQVVRQGGRFLAIYLSDVLLWLSLAGFFEILFVIVAGALCILTAGFIFEGMKKSPVVMVLGTAVALTGTFLVFREVRGFLWPAPTVAAPAPAPSSITPPPTTAVIPSPFDRPKTTLKPAKPQGSDCASRGPAHVQCRVNGCIWSLIFNRCDPLSGAAHGDKPAAPATVDKGSFCALSFTKITCSAISQCYWSPLTNRCEKLRFGRGLFLGTSSDAGSCAGDTLLVCLSLPNCTWSSKLKRCYPVGKAPPDSR